MPSKSLQVLISLGMVFYSFAAYSKLVDKVNMSFCDVGTSCQRCSETVAL